MHLHPDGGQALRQTVASNAAIRPSVRHSADVSTTTPALLTDKQAAALLGVSERKFHEMRPMLPAARVLGKRCVRWLRSELEQAILALPRQEQVTAPAQLLRGKIERMKACAAAGKSNARAGA